MCTQVDRLLGTDIAICDPVLMEVLAGAKDESHLRNLRALLGRTRLVRCTTSDFETAATLFRQCRRGGETVRRLIDCLIAAVAIREQLPVLQADADFTVLARHTNLLLY